MVMVLLGKHLQTLIEVLVLLQAHRSAVLIRFRIQVEYIDAM